MPGADPGPGPRQCREVRILNRVLKWTEDGIVYEPDQRHSEIAVREVGLEGAKAAPTAGKRKEQMAASVLVAALKAEVADESPELSARDASAYRGVAARCNYVGQDVCNTQLRKPAGEWPEREG